MTELQPDRRAVRVALIGFGRAGQTFHTPLIRATPGVELTVVASSRPNEVRTALPDVAVVPSPAEIWTLPSIDVVVVATPNNTHVPLAAAAIEGGKHVVVDKPFAPTLDEARRLALLAERHGRLLAAFQNRRWDGDFLAAKEIVRGDVLGGITHFESHFDRYRPQVRDRWRERPGTGSGVWNDLGPHLVDQALQLFGLPERVIGSFAALRGGARTDDWAHVVLEYRDRRVVLHASMLVAASLPRFIAHGSRGSWMKYGVDPQEHQLSESMGVDLGPPGPPERAVLVDALTGVEQETRLPEGDYRQFYRELRDAVFGAGRNPVPPAQAVAITAVVETASLSAADGCALALPLTAEERIAFRA
jgi:predicted dehydrogenase